MERDFLREILAAVEARDFDLAFALCKVAREELGESLELNATNASPVCEFGAGSGTVWRKKT